MPVTAPPNRPQPRPAAAQTRTRHPLQLALILVAAFMVVLDVGIFVVDFGMKAVMPATAVGRAVWNALE